MNNTLLEYSREIVPLYIALNTKNEILKEWKADNAGVQKRLAEIKAAQDELKAYVEQTESGLTREIKDVMMDISLAVKAAAKGTPFKAPTLKAYFAARAKENVSKVIEKGDAFAELDKELT